MIRSENRALRAVQRNKLRQLFVNKAGVRILRKASLNGFEVDEFPLGSGGEKRYGETGGDQCFAEGGVGSPNGVDRVSQRVFNFPYLGREKLALKTEKRRKDTAATAEGGEENGGGRHNAMEMESSQKPQS